MLSGDRHDLLAVGEEGQPGQLDVLQGERDADDGDGAQHRRHQMSQGQPPAEQDGPDQIAQGADAAAQRSRRFVGHLAPEGPEAEGADAKRGDGPGQADDGDGADERREPPGQAHDKAAEHEPQDVADQSHVSIRARQHQAK